MPGPLPWIWLSLLVFMTSGSLALPIESTGNLTEAQPTTPAFPTMAPVVTVTTSSGKIVCDSSEMLDYTNASPPRMLVLGLVALLIVIKTLAKTFPGFTTVFPESSLFVAFGIISGVPIAAFFPSAFNQEHFFDILLPMIVLEASYFMSNSDLMKNLTKILTFAVIGTIMNLIMIGGGLEFLKGYFDFEISMMHLLVYATILSAVDPVAVICVFEDMGVNEQLYINVFGESLLNDGVAVVCYRLFAQFAIEQREISFEMAGIAILDFFRSAIGGTIIGLIGAVVTSLATKFTYRKNIVQPIYCIFVPYGVYLLCENFHFSGIISIMICVIFMKPYTNVNLTAESKSLVNFLMKSISSCAESYIFMFLGISVYQVISNTDITFCIANVVLCIVARFISVFFLSFFLNMIDKEKLSIVDQFVMAYGGLRGAVCFGLVMALDSVQFPCKQYFASASIVVIVFTIFMQGVSIKYIVKLMKVKLSNKNNEQTRLEIFNREILARTMDGVASITGRSFWDHFTHKLHDFHERTLTRIFCVHEDHKVPNRSAIKITVRHEEIEKNEAFENFRKFGSFATLPTGDLSQNDIVMRKSQSMCQPISPFVCGPRIPESVLEEIEPPPTLDTRTSRIPRNVSDRRLLTAIFEEQKTIHKPYSRYFTEDEPEPDRQTLFQLFKNQQPTNQDAYNTIPNPNFVVPQPRRPSDLKKRATFFMGDLEDHHKNGDSDKKETTGTTTFKMGRFQVAKQSPSASTTEETSTLLNKIEEETKNL
uniref:Sodium/hydrogen exchanger n=1 Tax=Panagrellus redivivus TaxID=6233 RepID=A0A7E4VMS8_PANRE